MAILEFKATRGWLLEQCVTLMGSCESRWHVPDRSEVNAAGALQEWGVPLDSPNAGHNYSPCYPVFPGSSITPADAALLRAFNAWNQPRAKVTRGWPCVWDLAVFARCRDRLSATDRILQYIRNRPGPNLLNYSRNQADGTYGFTGAVAETLLQSHRGEVRLLPALSSNWPDGRVTGLRARGGLTVDIDWKSGNLASTRLVSTRSGPCVVCYGEKRIALNLRAGEPVRLDSDLKVK